MPVTYAYIENGGVLLVGTGTVVAADIIEVNKSIYASPEMIKNIRYQICDYTAVENMQISTDEIWAIADQDNRAAEVNPTMLISVAAKKDLSFGLSRVWEAYTDAGPFRTEVFRTVEDCREWIRSQLT